MCGTCTCVSHICSRLSTISHWKVLLQSYSNHSSELFHLFWSQLRINEFHFCSLIILLQCRCLWWRCRSNLQDLYSPGDPFTITPMLLNCFTILRSSKNPSNIRRCVSLKDLGTCGENVLVIVSLPSHEHTHRYSFKTFLGLAHIGEVKIFQITPVAYSDWFDISVNEQFNKCT